MRNVLSNNSEVAHIWASQSQEEGRANSMFFNGTIIYSYGQHFPMANIVSENIVLYTSKGYSNSTAKHLNHVRNAVSNRIVLTVPEVIPSKENHITNMEYFKNEIVLNQGFLKRARKNQSIYISLLEILVNDHNKYIDFFNLKHNKLEFNDLITQEELEAIENKRIETVKKENTKTLENLKKWRVDNSFEMRSSFYGLPVVLRLKNEKVETSHGANVPIDESIILIDQIDKGKNIEGFSIGHYTVEGIEDGFLIIGCHKVPLEEVKRISELISINS